MLGLKKNSALDISAMALGLKIVLTSRQFPLPPQRSRISSPVSRAKLWCYNGQFDLWFSRWLTIHRNNSIIFVLFSRVKQLIANLSVYLPCPPNSIHETSLADVYSTPHSPRTRPRPRTFYQSPGTIRHGTCFSYSSQAFPYFSLQILPSSISRGIKRAR